jgi:uncharacterized membrane protein YcaP (DUF421 family)
MDFSLYSSITVELLIGFISLLISVKIIGKRQVQQITPFDFVSAIVLGELLGNAIFDENTNFIHTIYSVIIWTILLVSIQRLTQKHIKIRRLLEGGPSLLIEKGKIDFDVLKKEKMDFNEFVCLLRERNIFSVREIEFAFIETSGVITAIKKAEYAEGILKDSNNRPLPTVLNLAVILDGDIMSRNVRILGYDTNWLKQQLIEHGISDPKRILYAEWNDHEGLYFQRKDEES